MSYTNASIVLNSRDATQGQYNNTKYNAENQNIVQGDIREIAVSEVNFPYDIPNMQAGFNKFYLTYNDVTDPAFIIQVPAGFYTGTELSAAVNAQVLLATQNLIPIPTLADLPTLTYTATTNTFRWAGPTNSTFPAYSEWYIYSSFTYPYLGDANNTTLGKDIFSIMGFAKSQTYLTLLEGSRIQGGSAPMAFTQYIDICSPELCKFQYFRDGSTTNLARRSDVICRLFICDNVSLTTNDPEGTRPFVINRQYINARIMKWTADNSVGTIDIQLYDDCGVPLTTTYQPRPFQITFNAYERTAHAFGNMSKKNDSSSDEDTLANKKVRPYKEKNRTVAWEQIAQRSVANMIKK